MMGQNPSQIAGAEDDSVENEAQIKDESHINGVHDEEREANYLDDRPMRAASSKSAKRSKKRKPLPSALGIDAALGREEAEQTIEHVSTSIYSRNSLATAQGEILRASLEKPGVRLEFKDLDNKAAMSIKSEIIPGDASKNSGAARNLKKGSRSRRSNSSGSKVLGSEGHVLKSWETDKALYVVEGVNQPEPLVSPGISDVDVNLKFSLSPKKPLNPVNLNGIETQPMARQLAGDSPMAQPPIPDASRQIETQMAIPGIEIRANQGTTTIEYTRRDPVTKRKRRPGDTLKSVNTPKEKKRRHHIEESNINISNELPLEDPVSQGSQMCIKSSSPAPLVSCSELSDPPAMKRASSPKFRVVIPVLSDPAGPTASSRSKKSKKRRSEGHNVASVIADRNSEQTHSPQNNLSPAQPLQEPTARSPARNKSSIPVNMDSESEPEFPKTQNDNYDSAEAQRTRKKRKRQLILDSVDPREQSSGSTSKKSRKSALKSKPFKDGKAQEIRQSVKTPVPKIRRSTPASSIKKPGTKEPTVTGKFSDDELIIIEHEMLKYREMHDMTTFDQNQLVQGKACGASELFDEICRALPGRTRSSIIKICRRRYHNFGARGKWTEDDDEALRAAYEQRPNAWKEISKTIDRHSEDVRDRWRNYLICGDNLRKTTWSEEEEQSLKTVVEECLENIRRIKSEKTAALPESQCSTVPDIELVDWQTVSLRLGRTRSRLQCISKWKQLQEREDPHNGKASDIEIKGAWRIESAKKMYQTMERVDKYELLLAIQDSRAGTEGKVPWKRLGDAEFQQKWPCMVRRLAWKRLRAKIPGNGNMKLQDIVYKLIDSFREILINDLSDIDSITPTPRRQTTRRKPARSEEYVHSDADELGEGIKRDPQAGARGTVNAHAEKHSDKNRREDIHTSEQEVGKKKGKKIRERMARADKSFEQSKELSEEESDHMEEGIGQEEAAENGKEEFDKGDDYGKGVGDGEEVDQNEDNDEGKEETEQEADDEEEIDEDGGIEHGKDDGDFSPLMHGKHNPTQDMVRNAVAEACEGGVSTDGGSGEEEEEDDDSNNDDIPARCSVPTSRLQSVEL